jgi:hypothetical protein
MVKWGGKENTRIFKCLCPASGLIRLAKIRQELESTGTSDDYDNGPYTSNTTTMKNAHEGSYSIINTNSTSRPGGPGTEPFQLAEWYDYNHNATSGMGGK